MKTDKLKQCEACPRKATRLIRGMCSACYQRARRGSVAVGTKCVVCGLSDGRLIRAVKLANGDQVTACHNHAWLAERMRPQPSTIEELKSLVLIPGDRRDIDRRQGNRRQAKVRRTDEERRWSRYDENEKRRVQSDRRSA